MDLIRSGEDSGTQFKADVRNAQSLASEMAAFSNSRGGEILIGVTDQGEALGLESGDVHRINQLISNAASQLVRSPLNVHTVNVLLENNRVVIVVNVEEGRDKPYFDKNGVIWLKNGADKRRVNSKEELRRIFQSVDLLHADELPTLCPAEDVDRHQLGRFLREQYGRELPSDPAEFRQLLQNLNLEVNGTLNLAGLLLFSPNPQKTKPSFVLKAAWMHGVGVSNQAYRDQDEFSGTLVDQFNGGMAFLQRVLSKRSEGVNDAPAWPVSRIVFEELLVNALIHRDYLIEASVRMLVFDDRVELISPGSLPNHLTVEKIRAGNSVIRNPILASFTAKGLLPYRGLGTGVRRALQECPALQFAHDPEAETFTATIPLTVSDETVDEPVETESGTVESQNEPVEVGNGTVDRENETVKPENETVDQELTSLQFQLMNLIHENPAITYPQMEEATGKGRATVWRHLNTLREKNLLRRVGSDRHGHWEVLHMSETDQQEGRQA
jgi:ATP-dependent DNA helicase RecG